MKSNLAILSSDQKSIDFIKKNKLSSTLNLYANSSRNIEVAQIFAETHNFKKYYGAYEDLIRDKGVDIVLNFLPSGIKFEYIYLCLKNNIKVITDYPIVSNSNDLKHYNKLINSKLINNLFLIDETNIKKLYEDSLKQNIINYTKSFQNLNKLENSLYSRDVLFELCPDLFYLIYRYREKKISIFKYEKILDKITNKLSNFNCCIEINDNIKINVILTTNLDNNSNKLDKQKEFLPNMPIYNLKDLNSFVNSKNSFEKLSIFTYYPYKLFQEVLYE